MSDLDPARWQPPGEYEGPTCKNCGHPLWAPLSLRRGICGACVKEEK